MADELNGQALPVHHTNPYKNYNFQNDVWTGHGNATKCLRFQMKTHPCGRGLNVVWS